MAQKERERRRRKVQVEQQAMHQLVEEENRETDLLEWLHSEAEEYRREAMHLHVQQMYKEAQGFERETRQRALMQKSEEAEAARSATRYKAWEGQRAQVEERKLRKKRGMVQGDPQEDSEDRPASESVSAFIAKTLPFTTRVTVVSSVSFFDCFVLTYDTQTGTVDDS